ncbi:MAG: hypothetical protein DI537_10110 [Stutzerimonas stutzeri]|nr:MAG: hypothetical protein DI537_10110 [Stutzerimonas stutzeri]
MPLTQRSPELTTAFQSGRPLEHPIDAYWQAPSGVGPLAASWKDKPHRIVYDLISALIHATPEGGTYVGGQELKSLRREYRPSMNHDVLHAWAADVAAAIDKLSAPAVIVKDQLETDRYEAAEAAWLSYDFSHELAAADGWERITPGNEWTRKIYLGRDEADAETVVGAFTVIFENASARVAEAFAVSNGARIGNCR